jgi:hypothetical protein
LSVIALLLTWVCAVYNDAFMGFPTFWHNDWFNFIFVYALPK